MSDETQSDREVLRLALAGEAGSDAKVIAERGLQVIALLLRKNADYGGSAWKTPVMAPHLTPRDAIQCRMSDKMARLHQLLSGKSQQVEESIEDTMTDLCGYCILWLTAPRFSGAASDDEVES